MTEDEMVGWHHRFDRHEFEQDLGVGDGQGSLVCCRPSMGLQSIEHDCMAELSDWLLSMYKCNIFFPFTPLK